MNHSKMTKFNDVCSIINSYKNKCHKSLELLEKYRTKESFHYIEQIKNNKDFFIILSVLTPQQKAPKQEARILKILDGKKIKAEVDKGDFVDKNGDFFEIKCSTPSKDGNVLNIVQIRLHQKIEYYLCVFIDDVSYENNYVFKLSKEQMSKECELIGHSAHGAAKKQQINKEMRISIKLDDQKSEDSKRWLENYRDKELEEKIF